MGLSELPPQRSSEGDASVVCILALLQAHTSQDFSQYKRSTLNHAIEGRMAACGIEKSRLYADYFRINLEESKLLFQGLLTQVTRFFRDPEAFVLLRCHLLPLFLDRPIGQVFRVWVPACATGEEAYSLAILLQELVDETGKGCAFQIFGNDLGRASIQAARTGFFPLSIARDVSPARLARFFTSQQHGYQVSAQLRESVRFATLDVATHPSWSRLDLISCRNLMIYLKPEFQNALMADFHRALRPGGLLLLSPSESINDEVHNFIPVSREWKLYQPSASRPCSLVSHPYVVSHPDARPAALQGACKEVARS